MSADALAKIHYYTIQNFTFQDGTTLPSVRLAYLDLNPQASKVAVIPTCFRGRLHSTLNFSNGVFKEWRVIVVALFGNGESSSPSNTTGFPKSLDYRDCVRAQRELVTHLGIDSIDAMAGFSMGGQTVYHWLLMYPGFVKNGIIICSSARTSRHNYQFLEGPRAALESSVDYVGFGGHSEEPKPIRGLRAFGKAYSAWLTSAEWFEEERYKTLGYETLAAWDEEAAGTFYDDWHPDDLLVMLRMWQNGDISKCVEDSHGSVNNALSQITARVLLMPSKTDQYFRWEASEKEARYLADATLEVIPSIWGHTAGGGINEQDTRWMDQKIARFLEES
ncbi:Alpha/Beta hydrolase protein [Hypoxylon rubiginosum]|uniref:Alpha/Beta hydrolase protein n=1 Tax=Hypoxylon rubiginosum TaxID=110542 RepID=A0ACC0CIF7_9PEZI|nr:Alpha/Beta hydrolase protein [Hypoxylon rubiginosum]